MCMREVGTREDAKSEWTQGSPPSPRLIVDSHIHTSQGGKLDDADNGNVVVAALREAEEEIGLVPAEVEVVGRMRPTLSLHLLEVHPVVARIPNDFVERARPNPEVLCVCACAVAWKELVYLPL